MNEFLDRDDELLAELQQAGRLDTVPAEALAAVKAAFMWRTIDAELAELTYDSLLDDELLAGVRSTSPARFLSFSSDPANLTVEMEAISEGGARRLGGQLLPAQPGEIAVRQAAGAGTVAVDELGRFTADGLSPGPVSLLCRAASGAAVTTDWVLV